MHLQLTGGLQLEEGLLGALGGLRDTLGLGLLCHPQMEKGCS